MRERWPQVALAEVAHLDIERVAVVPGETYRMAGVLNAGRGVFERDEIDGADTNYPALHRLRRGQLVMRKLTAWEGPITVVPQDFDGYFVSSEFPTFTLDRSRIEPDFMRLVCQTPKLWEAMKATSTGTVQRRKRVNPAALLAIKIDLPPLPEQRRIADLTGALHRVRAGATAALGAAENLYVALLVSEVSRALEGTALAPLHELAEVTLGKMLSQAAKKGDAEEFPYFRNADVQWDDLRIDDLKTMHFSRDQREKFRLRAGDVLVCEGGEVGRSAVVDRDLDGVFFQKAIHRVRCREALLPRFLMHLMRYNAVTGGFADLTSQLTIAHLTREKLLGLRLPLLDIPEQRRIAALLDVALETRRRSLYEARATEQMQGALATSLISADRQIPESYNRFLEEEADRDPGLALAA